MALKHDSQFTNLLKFVVIYNQKLKFMTWDETSTLWSLCLQKCWSLTMMPTHNQPLQQMFRHKNIYHHHKETEATEIHWLEILITMHGVTRMSRGQLPNIPICQSSLLSHNLVQPSWWKDDPNMSHNAGHKLLQVITVGKFCGSKTPS